MLDLAEDSLTEPRPSQRLMRVAIALGVVVLIALTVWWLRGLVGAPDAAKRQVAKISILPDTPPPPPPPPKVEKKPEPPKDEPKQVMRDQPIKQPDAPKPADAPIKMEGAAGDGPSAFGAGTVSQEYKGGAPIVGASGPSGVTVDRAQERFYANSARQMLRDEIEKNLRPEAGEVVATFSVWIEPNGRIQKFELAPGANPTVDAEVRAALDATSKRLQLPTHSGITQPLRFRLSVRAAG